MPLAAGQTLNNRYRIVKLLGQGGFGAVYRAWDVQMEGACAVKENLDTSSAAQRQFEREAKLLYKLRHPNLPRVFDHFVIEGQGQYLVMDFIEGQDLESMLHAADGPLPEAQVLDWIGQVSDALTYLHSQDPPIIHRDIKPANIRITPDSQAVLVDFGIAKSSDPGMQTSTGARALTPGFAPIEQYGLGKTDARSDIYALGATLYTLMTGERPVESVQRTIKENLKPPESFNPGVTAALSTSIRRALEMDPDRRFQSAAEFKGSLKASVESEPALFRPVSPTQLSPAPYAIPASQPIAAKPRTPTSQLRWGLLGGAVILAVLVIGAVIVGIYGVFLYNNIKKTDSTQTVLALATNVNGATLSAGLSQATPPESQMTPTGSSSPTLSYEIMATSTLFSPAEKPADIPVMPGAKELQVFHINQGENNSVIQVVFYVEGTEAEIIAYYEREMPANGWVKTGTYADANNQIHYFQKDKRVAMVTISQKSTPRQVGIMVMQQ